MVRHAWSRFSRTVSILVLVLASAAPALAQDEAAAPRDPDAELAVVREHVLYARYVDATTAVDALLARTDLTALQRNAGLEARAIILIARRRLPDARQVLAQLYARDPEHRVLDRDAGPNVHDEFERARSAAATGARVTVSLEDRTEDTSSERRAPTIEVAIGEGLDAVHEVRLSYRNDPSDSFERTIMRLDAASGLARGRVPLREGSAAYELQYFVEVVSPSGFTLGRAGSPEEPLRVAMPEQQAVVATVDPAALSVSPTTTPAPAGGSVVEEWWFWTIVGVVVIGGAAAGIGIGLTTGQGPAPGSLGEGRL